MGEEGSELHVELYQTITYLDPIQQGTPVEWFNDPSLENFHIEVELIGLLTSLTLKKEAALLHPPMWFNYGSQQDVLPLHNIDPNINLIIEDEEPSEAMFGTFGVLIEILEAAVGQSFRQKLLHCGHMKLRCYPDVLESFLWNVSRWYSATLATS